MTYHFIQGEVDRLPWHSLPFKGIERELRGFMLEGRAPLQSATIALLCGDLERAKRFAAQELHDRLSGTLTWLSLNFPKNIHGTEEKYLKHRNPRLNPTG